MNVKEMNTDDMEMRIGEVTEEIARIKFQIGEAKGIAADTGDYSDPSWFRRAELALRLKGREHQALLQELSRRKKEERRQYNSRLEQVFINVAKARLDDATFDKLWGEALQMSGCAEGSR